MRKHGQAAGLKVTAASTTRPQIERTGSRKRGEAFLVRWQSPLPGHGHGYGEVVVAVGHGKTVLNSGVW
jgi:hypothetical protein